MRRAVGNLRTQPQKQVSWHLLVALLLRPENTEFARMLIAPGLIYNEFLERIYDKEWFEMQEQQNLLGRIGQSGDVAGLAVFLASDDSSFITGEVMCISGGRYMHA